MESRNWNKYNLENGQIFGCYIIIDVGPYFLKSQPNRGYIKVKCNKCRTEYLKRRDSIIYKPVGQCRNCANKNNYLKNKEKGIINRKGYTACGHRGIGKLSKTQYSKYRYSAKKRNIHWDEDVTLKYLWDLFIAQNGKCALSGLELKITGEDHEPITTKNGNINTSLDLTASLDRIDSNIGYIIGNLQWVHVRINFMKNTYSQEEFVKMCTLVALTQKRKKYE